MADARDRTPFPRVALVLGALLVGALAFIGLGLLISSPAHDLPEVVWIRGAAPLIDRELAPGDVRIGTATGSVLTSFHTVSTWGSTAGGEGISFGKDATPGEERLARLARWGVLPRYRTYGAGYGPTGEVAALEGEVWREFRCFDPEFNFWHVGWWPW